ncbi:MAG: SDR family NAD(P)-dependent oxidoreductase [Myxococcota bacterium]
MPHDAPGTTLATTARRDDFPTRFGRWAIVAGASEGLGAAFSEAVARRGMSVVAVARRTGPLEATAGRLRETYGVEVEALSLDVAARDFADRLAGLAREREVGLGIYNAACAPVGALLDKAPEELMTAVDVNVRGPLLFARMLGPEMAARGRGGLVLMSSLAGFQGSPRLATYAATKAFNTVLGESLWAEWRAHGVDVLASCAGAIRTPGYAEASGGDAPGTLDADVVAERTLAALGRGPRVVPGFVNKIASLTVGRWLPRRAAVRIMAASTKDLT